jgi:hypothetical protein
MSIVMNMSSYKIEHDPTEENEYSEEVMYSGWNPDVALACQQQRAPGNITNGITDPELALVEMFVF